MPEAARRDIRLRYAAFDGRRCFRFMLILSSHHHAFQRRRHAALLPAGRWLSLRFDMPAAIILLCCYDIWRAAPQRAAIRCARYTR